MGVDCHIVDMRREHNLLGVHVHVCVHLHVCTSASVCLWTCAYVHACAYSEYTKYVFAVATGEVMVQFVFL